MAIDDAEVLVRLKNQFDADPHDPTGSVAVAHVQAAFASGRPELQGAHLDAVECRKSLCRLGVRFDDRRADRRAMTALFGPTAEPLLQLGSFVAPGRDYLPDGSVKLSVYVARSGNIDLELLG